MMDDRSGTTRHRSTRPDREAASYDRDLYTWAIEQAALLRAGRIEKVDARNIAEELDDVGSEQYNKLESALRVVLLHLLKWDHQPQRRSRSWWGSITVQRNHVRKVLRKNPGLKPRVDEAIGDAYQDARILAAVQTKLSLRAFPARCPYRWDDIMERKISWPPEE
jgi:hypothetical protein